MYGKGVGTVNTAAGVAVLPNTGDNKPLFFIASFLLVSGLVILLAATLAARKQKGEAN